MNLLRRLRGEMETPRLLLRRWERRDFNAYIAIVSDPQVMVPAGCSPAETMQAANDAFSRDLRNEDCYAIALRESGEVIGRIKYQSDLRRFHVNSISVGYELRRDCWGNGYMTEALEMMVRNAFERRGVDVVATSHYADNQRSRRVIEKCGFKLEGVVPWACKRADGKICDDVCYSILRTDYVSGASRRGE
ncbi:GNAT family N-acetyltransferase [Acutalibacter caecimuris]|uniref:GNAT family N-acetyltransferase n=1 Tax=Acutalibacter caecimuris TaxID=3093657 RepID=UPI002AC9EAFC|nr:GNAT family N-acetyltransferase [Acutalibacter sp. M00118]